VDRRRDHVLTGKERHAWVRKDGRGYPCRAIRTHEFLYIRNFLPDRWPAGDPVDGGEPYYSARAYGDIDNAPSKTFMMKHRDDPDVKPLFERAFQKRPAEELYDLREDPEQLDNVADRAEYASVRSKLASTLTAELLATKDPRSLDRGDAFDRYPYYGGRQPRKE